MVADLVKRRVYGWRPTDESPNAYYLDAFRHPARWRAIRVLAARDCFCQSERYRKAFDSRQLLRGPHLERHFAAPAPIEVGACHPAIAVENAGGLRRRPPLVRRHGGMPPRQPAQRLEQ